jgi:DNA (cytosine-5)-methyltransferase 1
MGYHRAGFDVLGVDLNPQPRYPFHFRQMDALQALQAIIDRGPRRIGAIHASPPCQSFTAYRRKGHGVGDGYADLIAETRQLLQQTGLAYVIENVPGAPLQDPIQLCGSSFGLDVRRHRLFETDPAGLESVPCNHSWQTPRFPAATNRAPMSRCTVEIGVWRIPLQTQQNAMGIDWMTLSELSEAIPPAYTEHIGRQLMEHLM